MLTATHLFLVAVALRIGFFSFGLYQDAYLPVKYTDIDYLVFSDAAEYVSKGLSPYLRETYRYTPLLAWMLVPNSQPYLYSFGKFVFMISDLITGAVILKLLQRQQQQGILSARKTLILSSIWLLNPMVITISTRGSSESVLTVLIMLSFYFLRVSNLLSAVFLGLAIHFKIYPFIYLPSIMLFLSNDGKPFVSGIPVVNWVNWKNLQFLLVTLITVAVLNGLMYMIYGYEFLFHSYLYHLTRVDHRHNFSVYNVAMYFQSAFPLSSNASTQNSIWGLLSVVIDNLEKFAFVPQFAFSTIIIPLLFARKDLLSCVFFQTFAFVIFNKVMTSQYFIWFLIFLPHYLSKSKLLAERKKWLLGGTALFLWVVSQASWLFFAYKLEFLGESTFNYELFTTSAFFFLTNCWILGVFMENL